MSHQYNQTYTGKNLTRSGFPLGGIGAGMLALEGSGKLAQVSIRHNPRLFFEPFLFSAVHVSGVKNGTRILEGPTPDWKISSPWDDSDPHVKNSGSGLRHKTYGLPHFQSTTFTARFPFASVDFHHEQFPLQCKLDAFSPFIPTDADNSSLPTASMQYTFTNPTDHPIELVYSFHSDAFVRHYNGKNDANNPPVHVLPEDKGFVITQPAAANDHAGHAEFSAWCDAPETQVDCAWFRGGWFDAHTQLMAKILRGDSNTVAPLTEGAPSPGASLYVPIKLKPGEERTVTVLLTWYVPNSDVHHGQDQPACDNDTAIDDPTKQCCEVHDASNASNCCNDTACKPTTYRPWYATRFKTGAMLRQYWRSHCETLKSKSKLFADTFFASTLPPEIIEAVSANLSILKSPTVLRQHDGKLWAWEGCHDDEGCCAGSCTHVWNYAQAVCHLFPDLERTLRDTEFGESQYDCGAQMFRAALPIGASDLQPTPSVATDGQLGGLIKLYRDWRISDDTAWLRSLWPAASRSIDYCISTWDPDETGLIVEPHHNTYDIEFWGPDGLCSSFYLGALCAMSVMAKALNEPHDRYDALYAKGRAAMESQLYDGEYFNQLIRWEGLRAKPPHMYESNALKSEAYSPEAMAMLRAEGPKYQYGIGCLSDGVLGAWMARVSGLGDIIDAPKIASHLDSVYRYNFRETLIDHINPQRSAYAYGDEAGLLLCSWPKGGRLSLPFPYSEEVWTGIEYQVASHLLMFGKTEQALTIVRAVRDRYDGVRRNPFNEIECGHWYARALSSYGLLQGITGIRYDAVDRTLTIKPTISGDFKSFLSTASGFGLVGVEGGEAFIEVAFGTIDVQQIDYVPCD